MRIVGKTFLKETYATYVRHIETSIVANPIPSDDGPDIDIKSAFERSQATLGQYTVLDWDHRTAIRALINTIKEYRNDSTRQRPLNILLHAPPGSGKSHFVKSLAAKMGESFAAVTFNMATLDSAEGLVLPLDECRNRKVQDQLPILFLDEFDSHDANYATLLPLLWDGELRIVHRNLAMGKIVIILAGSTESVSREAKAGKSFEARSARGNNHTPAPAAPGKLGDLLSRINSADFVIPSLEDRHADKVCLSVALLHRRFPSLECAPWALLHFIATTQFKHGARSVASLIDLIPSLDATGKLLMLEHPALMNPDSLQNSSLAYHVKAKSAESVVERWLSANKCRRMVRFAEKSVTEEEDFPTTVR